MEASGVAPESEPSLSGIGVMEAHSGEEEYFPVCSGSEVIMVVWGFSWWVGRWRWRE